MSHWPALCAGNLCKPILVCIETVLRSKSVGVRVCKCVFVCMIDDVLAMVCLRQRVALGRCCCVVAVRILWRVQADGVQPAKPCILFGYETSHLSANHIVSIDSIM